MTDIHTITELYKADIISRQQCIDVLTSIGFSACDAELIVALAGEPSNNISFTEYTIPEGGDSAAW